MADIKSIVKGTASSVGSKAKNYVESGALMDSVLKSTAKMRCYADIARLSLAINGELEEQNKVFIEIGRLFYDENRDFVSGKYAALFDELEERDRRIEEMRAELEAVKAAVAASKNKELIP